MKHAEATRLQAVIDHAVLDTPPEPAFDRIAHLAAKLLNVPVATISFTDETRHWFKASHGFDYSWAPRYPSFDPCTSNDTDVFVVLDALNDSKATCLPVVQEAPYARFYAGMPLISQCGQRLGSLSVVDTKPWTHFSEHHTMILSHLAGLVMDLVNTRLNRTLDDPTYTSAMAASMVCYDPLTGLANRQRLRERLQELLDDTERTEQICLLALDLDHLESMIEQLGHPEGDLLLRKVADRLREAVPPGDMVIRFMGGGFGVLHCGARDERTVISLARKLIRITNAPFQIEGRLVSFTTSIGIAPALGAALPPEQLIRNAREAVMRARAGGGGYRVYEYTMGRRAERRQAIRLDLGGALERNEFRLAYQPLVDLQTGRVASFEALLRWQHPVRGEVPPSEFIPVAEQTGLIDDIGNWVMRQACLDAAQWSEPFGVAVNLSPVQFRANWLTAAIRRALDDAGLDPSRLELEITENVMLPDTGANMAVLRELRALGVRVAMDDFGAGHASFGYLKSFAFDKIKIDQMFVRDMPGTGESAAIVRAITGLARDLGVCTVAEGVENTAQLEQIRAESCDLAQGYLFSRPVPCSEIPDVLASLGHIMPKGFTPTANVA